MNDYRHKLDFLNGAQCGYHPADGSIIKVGLSWKTITCPACLRLKQPEEPEEVVIDTRGD